MANIASMSGIRLPTWRAQTARDLPIVVDLIRDRPCDLHLVALDDQTGRLHVPVLRSPRTKGPTGRVIEGELMVAGVVEFSLTGATGVRWFRLGGLSYQHGSRQLAISSNRSLRFLLTVDHLDVTVRRMRRELWVFQHQT